MAFDLRQTIIETIKYGEIKEDAKAELLDLMEYTSASFQRSNEWSGPMRCGTRRNMLN